MRTRTYVLLAIVAILAAGAQAAFMVEAHSSGRASATNFNGTGTASLKSTAVGTTATNSIFGGSHNYTYSFTPALDADNYLPAAGVNFGNGDLSSGLVGGAPGLYNVYITWPLSTNVSTSTNSHCKITVTSDGVDVVRNPVNNNTGGTGTPGGNSAWYCIGRQVHLTTGTTYTVNQLANSTEFVSQRSHGVMWELVTPDPTVATIDESGGGTTVAESGITDSYTIALKTQPTANVVVSAEPLDPNQITINGQESKIELLFTPNNWDVAQAVTVGALDDEAIEGDHAVMILHLTQAADPNFDPGYKNGFGGLVYVDITDNEVPDVRITESGGSTNVDEQDATSDTYTMRLLYPPTDLVTITITADADTVVNTGAGAGATAQLVFTRTNWATEQTVTVTAVDDVIFENRHISTIQHAVASLDGGYAGLAVRNVSAIVEDNECGVWGILEMDFNRDCVVGLADLAEFAAQWLECTMPYGDNCQDLR